MPSRVVRDVHLELTNICNLACLMCPVATTMKRKKTAMEFALIKKIVEENPQVKCYGLNNWGEPLLHPQFNEIIEYLDKNNKKFYFATNAVLLESEIAKRLVNSNLTAIYFSIDATGVDYEKIRGGSYQKVKNNILSFLSLIETSKKQIQTQVVATISQWNESVIDTLKKEWKPYMKITTQPMLTFKKDSRRGKCYELFKEHLVVLSNGKVVPCCADYEGALEIGDARFQSLNEIINSERIEKLRSDPSGSLCDYCSEYKSNVTKDRFKTYTQLKRLFEKIF